MLIDVINQYAEAKGFVKAPHRSEKKFLLFYRTNPDASVLINIKDAELAEAGEKLLLFLEHKFNQ